MIKRVQFWLGWLFIQILARIPYTVANGLAHVSVGFMWMANSRARPITEVNLGICFPEMTPEQRQSLVKASLFETNASIIDMARCWVRSKADLEERISKVDGLEYLDETAAAGRGTLVLLPHLGSWEIVSLYLSSRYSVTALYREPRTKALADFIRQQRQRHGARLISIGTAGLRAVLQALRANDMALLFPDQVPPRHSGQFAPFFGEPTLTMTLGSKLLQRSGARAVCAYCKRLPGGRYELVFRPVDEAIYDVDLNTSLAGLNKSVEACVRECPEQYQWEYRRFKFLTDYRRRYYW
ncbi:MAG TPA: lysophospholipid acyltransferase family protein [Woeseiaceae bacterium]|nr:lysophospholipid acyltransferase family protein [Woeseiaceae bacterium]